MAAAAQLTLVAPGNEKFTVRSAPARLPKGSHSNLLSDQFRQLGYQKAIKSGVPESARSVEM
jgi:hypothetical protein